VKNSRQQPRVRLLRRARQQQSSLLKEVTRFLRNQRAPPQEMHLQATKQLENLLQQKVTQRVKHWQRHLANSQQQETVTLKAQLLLRKSQRKQAHRL